MIDTHPAGLPDSGRGNPRTKNYRTGGGNPGHPPNREARVGGVQHGRPVFVLQVQGQQEQLVLLLVP